MGERVYIPTKEQADKILGLIGETNDSGGGINEGSLNAKLNNLTTNLSAVNSDVITAINKISNLNSNVNTHGTEFRHVFDTATTAYTFLHGGGNYLNRSETNDDWISVGTSGTFQSAISSDVAASYGYMEYKTRTFLTSLGNIYDNFKHGNPSSAKNMVYTSTSVTLNNNTFREVKNIKIFAYALGFYDGEYKIPLYLNSNGKQKVLYDERGKSNSINGSDNLFANLYFKCDPMYTNISKAVMFFKLYIS